MSCRTLKSWLITKPREENIFRPLPYITEYFLMTPSVSVRYHLLSTCDCVCLTLDFAEDPWEAYIYFISCTDENSVLQKQSPQSHVALLMSFVKLKPNSLWFHALDLLATGFSAFWNQMQCKRGSLSKKLKLNWKTGRGEPLHLMLDLGRNGFKCQLGDQQLYGLEKVFQSFWASVSLFINWR